MFETKGGGGSSVLEQKTTELLPRLVALGTNSMSVSETEKAKTVCIKRVNSVNFRINSGQIHAKVSLLSSIRQGFS